MVIRTLVLLIGLGLAAIGSPSAAETSPIVVELFTSQGCSSCPPADALFGELSKRRDVLALGFHVDYWDYIGWKDPYAKREFSQRQRRLSQLQRLALVYTPQVLLQGSDFRSWGGAEFERALERINAQPARARLELEILATTPDALQLRAQATIPDPAQRPDAALYVAAYENRLESRVSAGENRGRLLAHDHVALEWQGPYALGERRLKLALLPKAKTADSGVVAFVQNQRTAEVLQALMLAACLPSRI